MVDVNKLKEQLGVSDADLAKAQQWATEQRKRDEAAKTAFLRKVTPRLLDLLGQGFELGMEHAITTMVKKLEEDRTIADPTGSNGGSGSRDILR